MTAMQGDQQAEQSAIHVLTATPGDLARIVALANILRKPEAAEEFSRHFDMVESGERTVLIGVIDGRDAGYCVFNRNPKYGLFRKLGIPELQDLNVIPEMRRRGIARQIITHCESLARSEGFSTMGLGVGLHAGYGPAQRLYVSMGYVPDGMGVSYDRTQVANGEFRPLDDCLCLMMVKEF